MDADHEFTEIGDIVKTDVRDKMVFREKLKEAKETLKSNIGKTSMKGIKLSFTLKKERNKIEEYETNLKYQLERKQMINPVKDVVELVGLKPEFGKLKRFAVRGVTEYATGKRAMAAVKPWVMLPTPKHIGVHSNDQIMKKIDPETGKEDVFFF